MAAAAADLLPPDQPVGASPVLLDFEFKVDDQGVVQIKQVRPFVAGQDASVDRLLIDVPRPLELCAMWRPGVAPRQARSAKAVLSLSPGLRTFDLGSPEASHHIFGDLRLGVGGAAAEPVGPGVVAVSGTNARRVDVTRRYRVPGDAGDYEVALGYHGLSGGNHVRALTADTLTGGLPVVLSRVNSPSDAQLLGPCGLPDLPMFQLELVFPGGRIDLVYRAGRGDSSYTWTELVAARLALQSARASGLRTVTGYDRLTYAAARHNWSESYLATLEPPLGEVAGVLAAAAPDGDRYTVTLLNSNLDDLEVLAVYRARKRAVTTPFEPPAVFLPRAVRSVGR